LIYHDETTVSACGRNDPILLTTIYEHNPIFGRQRTRGTTARRTESCRLRIRYQPAIIRQRNTSPHPHEYSAESHILGIGVPVTGPWGPGVEYGFEQRPFIPRHSLLGCLVWACAYHGAPDLYDLKNPVVLTISATEPFVDTCRDRPGPLPLFFFFFLGGHFRLSLLAASALGSFLKGWRITYWTYTSRQCAVPSVVSEMIQKKTNEDDDSWEPTGQLARREIYIRPEYWLQFYEACHAWSSSCCCLARSIYIYVTKRATSESARTGCRIPLHIRHRAMNYMQ
jgi:hypothetical protein